MSTSITVRDIDPADKSWLKREARGAARRPRAGRLPRGLAVLTRNLCEFRNTGVESVDPWTADPR